MHVDVNSYGENQVYIMTSSILQFGEVYNYECSFIDVALTHSTDRGIYSGGEKIT